MVRQFGVDPVVMAANGGLTAGFCAAIALQDPPIEAAAAASVSIEAAAAESPTDGTAKMEEDGNSDA